MDDAATALYAVILDLPTPWMVTGVQVDRIGETVEVHVAVDAAVKMPCPRCRLLSPQYDSQVRTWRHLDTCQYETRVVCAVPRVQCRKHGVLRVQVPWAEGSSRFTALFEARVIDWLHEASISGVARVFRLSWDQVDGIQRRAVERGLARRRRCYPRRIGVDETSFRKRHEYVTVVTDLDRGVVLSVADGRKKGALAAFLTSLTPAQAARIEAVAMDMWQPFIQAVKEHLPDGEAKICFDKFHVAKHLGDAVDKVRRQEHRALCKEGEEVLKGTKYLWMQNPANMSAQRWHDFDDLRRSTLKTARAWHIKELAMSLWNYSRQGWALRAWTRWLAWVQRCRLTPMAKVGRMVRAHLRGILNAIIKGVTNALGESVNSKIQSIKRTACGFRNRERFRMAIYFHCGGLDLYPRVG